ncbi:MAG: hypothetical protein ACQEW9_02255 [Bacteroidota bacterium]
MKLFLSLFLFGLSWLDLIIPNTNTPALPQWEQQAIKYGEGDPELECLYREILFSIHQQEERQRNRINLLMHLEVLPHAELHARDRILDELMAEHEHQSDQQLIQTDTIKNDHTLKNLQKFDYDQFKFTLDYIPLLIKKRELQNRLAMELTSLNIKLNYYQLKKHSYIKYF